MIVNDVPGLINQKAFTTLWMVLMLQMPGERLPTDKSN